MDTDLAKKQLKILTDDAERQLIDFLRLSLPEKLEEIRQRIDSRCDDRLPPLLNDLIQDLKTALDDGKSSNVENINIALWEETKTYSKMFFLDYVILMTLQSLLVSPYSGLSPNCRQRLLKKQKSPITAADLRDAIFETFKRNYLGELDYGGDRREIFDNAAQKLNALACYNRFSIIIKAARSELKKAINKGIKKSESKTVISQKYKIPRNFHEFLFDEDSITASDLALEWTKEISNFPGELSTLKTKVLPKARIEAKRYLESHNINWEGVAAPLATNLQLIGINVESFSPYSPVTFRQMTVEDRKNMTFKGFELIDGCQLYYV